MSHSSYFLSKQKKAELVEMAEKMELPHEGLKKTELEIAIEDELNNNSPKYSNDLAFAGFFKRRSEGSPVKKESSTALEVVENKAKAVRRRVTKASDELLSAATDDSEVEPATTRMRSALVQTPRRTGLSRLAQDIPLPPSPAVVAEAIDRRTAVMRAKIADYYEESGIIEATQNTRESLSSVVSVHALIILFELYKLRPEILADRYAFTIPALGLLHTSAYPIYLPDMFLLLTASFWSPALTWAFTTFFIPLFASYFVNLTSKPKGRTTHFAYSFDPLTFNIVKALLVFVVFGQDVTFGGLVDLESVARINSAVYGGYQGVLAGTGIGTLVTLYEAVIRK